MTYSTLTRRVRQAVLVALLASPLLVLSPLAAAAGATQGFGERAGATAPSGTSGDLNGVSCVTTSFCLAVGVQPDSNAISEEWNGKSWVDLPAGRSSAGFESVDCSTTDACLAVGDQSPAPQGFAQDWSGTSWRTVSPTSPADELLSGVSCAGGTSCIAVGAYVPATTEVPLAQSWNGHAWATLPTVVPKGGSQLISVSCRAGAACMAVGSKGDEATAELQTGGKWKIVTPRTPSKSTNLVGVSCASTSQCMAVGVDSAGAGKTLAELWSGSGWSVTTGGVAKAALASVSCPSASFCMAVGRRLVCTSSICRYRALAQSWDGSAWSTFKMPTPAGSQESYLLGVSCASPTWCMAVGYNEVQAIPSDMTLAEIWDGASWTIVPS